MHRHNILEKFSVRSLAELAVMAERLGLLSAADCGNKKELSRPIK
jgi:hypothetical protein